MFFDFVLVPNPPSGVRTSGVTCTSASFNWSAPNGHADEYVYHCQGLDGTITDTNKTQGLLYSEAFILILK